MSKKNPDLATKYEEDDETFELSSDEDLSNQTLRVNPPRRAKLKNKETAETQSVSPERSEPVEQLGLLENIKHNMSGFVGNLFNKNPSDSQAETKMASFTPDQFSLFLTKVVDTVKGTLEAGGNDRSSKNPTPKVDIPKLTMENYQSWSATCQNALKLYKLWLDPALEVSTLNEEQKDVNERAALFVGCYLDQSNMALVNEGNRNCFISLWKAIQNFHKPSTSTVLTDVFIELMSLKFNGNESVGTHIMKMENLFSKLIEVKEPLSDQVRAAIIMASVQNAKKFEHIFSSALWTDKESLTV
jgi:gag-polypeptide of LTR copia-type